MNESLRVALNDWTDIDAAGYALAVALGLIDPVRSPFATKAKHVFWSVHPVGNVLFHFLHKLVEVGALERREEPDVQVRWNSTFRGSWE